MKKNITETIAAMSTKDIVETYNRINITGNAVSKFADRKTAEKRLTNLVTQQIELGAICPDCWSTEVYVGRVDSKGFVVDEDSCGGCHHCSWSWGSKQREGSATQSAGIAASWLDPEVRAARTVRTGVVVDGVAYRSVAAAFRALGLPMSKHIRFRLDLKQLGEQQILGHNFVAMEVE